MNPISAMSRIAIVAGSLALASGQAIAATLPASVTLGFDDIPNRYSDRVELGVKLSGFASATAAYSYGGFVWEGVISVQDYGFYNATEKNRLAKFPETDNQNHLVNALAESGGGPITMRSESLPFYFQGVHLGGYRSAGKVDPSFTAMHVQVDGLDEKGGVVFSDKADLSPVHSTDMALALFEFEWDKPVFGVRFVPGGTSSTTALFLMDNVNVQFVPLPAAGFLLPFGLMALWMGRRRNSEATSQGRIPA